mmetsp:Transcript_6322/g.7973  ORF Transcript_6322/g.7973 Transcript_6322/m.7973 type:complete len:189 (-) Transcript_6322:1066-1632(-)
MAKFFGVGIGVGVICLDDEGRILVGKRKGSHGAGKFALPGGHLELNETWEDCARREVFEEANLQLEPQSLKHVFTSNDRMEDDKHYVTLFLLGRILPGSKLLNLEPEKCEGWEFLSWKQLRDSDYPMFMPLRHLLDSTDSDRAPWERGLYESIPGSLKFGATTLFGALFALVVVKLKGTHFGSQPDVK